MGDRLFRNRAILVLLVIVATIAILDLIRVGDDVDDRRAPPGSSYSTNDGGHAALGALLDDAGHRVERARASFADAPPSPDATVFVLDGFDLSVSDQNALRTFVESGGRLVSAGQSLRRILDADVAGTVAGTRTVGVVYPHPELHGVETVTAPSGAAMRTRNGLLPLLGTSDRPLLAVATVGEGSVWVLADSSPLSNEALDETDNALLALALAGSQERTVVFTEYVHGYVPPTGLGALPSRWQGALWLALLAGIVWMISRGRRLGPPEQRERRLPPPRVAYVDAMAANLARTKDPGRSTQPIRDRIQRELQRRGADNDEGTTRVAQLLDLDPAAITRSLEPPVSDHETLEAGLVLARLSTRTPER